MSLMYTVWNGTPQEGAELRNIVGNNCVCATDARGDRIRCSSHRMLLADQRALDGLVFARRIGPRLRREEFNAPSPGPDG